MDVMVAEVQKWLNDTYAFGVVVDGITGNATFTALIKALQTEIGVTADGDFGSATLAACPTMQEVDDVNTAQASNLHYILQGSFWCKGYNPGGFTGIFGPNTTSAVKEFQSDAGIDQDGIVTPYILQGIMNTDGYAFTETDDVELNYKHQVQMGLNKYYGSQIGLIAPNGDWERKSHRNLIKACQIEWGATVDGIWGSGTMSSAPTLSINTSGYTNSKRLLQWSLAVNGFYADNLDGTFNTSTREAVIDFQELMELGADGIAGQNTWASLLVSYGNTSRTGTACDTATRLTASTAAALKSAGYEEVGRYLTNVDGSALDKKMTDEELQIIEAAGLKVFPIFQTYGGEASYFTNEQGQSDAAEAKAAAQGFGFPATSVIYFAVDYDVLMADISSNIIPYFEGVNSAMGGAYQIGVYGPRSVCNSLSENGLTARSFVSDMSSGFTGNIGVKMPSNWAYDQVVTTSVGTLSIDKCIASSARKTAVSPSEFVEYPSIDEIVSEELEAIKKIYELAVEYLKNESSDGNEDVTVEQANGLSLRYLRSSEYESALWTIIAGDRDQNFVDYVSEKFPEFDPKTYSFTNPGDQSSIGIAHLFATLNANYHETLGFDFNFLERDVDSFAGWAGDLIQMGSIIERSVSFGYNYFNVDDLIVLIGSTTDDLTNYHLYEIAEDNSYVEMTTKNTGFSLEDLYQDVDGYNISQLYDLSSTPIYSAMNDYYITSKYYKKRFSLFKQNLLTQFNRDTLFDVASEFTNEEVLWISSVFDIYVNAFSETLYGNVLAEGFEAKINRLIAQEE